MKHYSTASAAIVGDFARTPPSLENTLSFYEVDEIQNDQVWRFVPEISIGALPRR
jgi:hypothetical protein